MTREEAIKRYKNNAEYERTHGNLQGCLEFRQLAKWLESLDKIRAEIKEKERIEHNTEDMFYNMAINECLGIINKYTESEE